MTIGTFSTPFVYNHDGDHWWEHHWGSTGVWVGPHKTLTIEEDDTLRHPIGFTRLRERHRVKAISVKR